MQILKLPKVIFPEIIADRWEEANDKKDMATWRSFAYLCGAQADLIHQHEPDNILAFALIGVASEAHERYMAMMPNSHTEH